LFVTVFEILAASGSIDSVSESGIDSN